MGATGLTRWLVSELQSTLAVWVKWPQHPSAPFLNGLLRQHGAVCHQDPRYHENHRLYKTFTVVCF